MGPKISLFLSFFILFYINANGFDITQILDQHPEFSSFNSYLTQTKLAADINSRQTITVLVVDNGNASPLSGLSPDALKNALSVHVVLDYFDVPKIQKLSSKTTTVTTLFQASGNARGQQGFLNITHASDSISFTSAVAGSNTVSSLLKSVMSQPYNISVLQVSNVIIPPAAANSTSGNSTTSPPSPPPPAKAPSAAPSKSPTASPPKSSPAPPKSSPAPPKSSPAPPKPSPAPSNSSEAPAEAATPPATASATAPAADAPAASTPAAADAPAAATPAAADAPPTDKPSGSGKAAHVGVSVVLAVVVSAVCLASKV